MISDNLVQETEGEIRANRLVTIRELHKIIPEVSKKVKIHVMYFYFPDTPLIISNICFFLCSWFRADDVYETVTESFR